MSSFEDFKTHCCSFLQPHEIIRYKNSNKLVKNVKLKSHFSQSPTVDDQSIIFLNKLETEISATDKSKSLNIFQR